MPFTNSARGNRCIVIAVDYVTKWAMAVSIPIAGAKQVAEFFFAKMI